MVFLHEAGTKDILMRRDCIAVSTGGSAQMQKPHRKEKEKPP
jgi:hypothetical protein